MKKLLIGIIIPLVIGLIIYLVFSPNTYITKTIWHVLNVDNPFAGIDVTEMPVIVKLSRYYLCDVLWAFSFTNMLIMVLWQKNSKNGFYIALSFSIIIELSQIFFLGTFDVCDIFVEVFGCFMALLFNNRFDHSKSKEEN